MATQTKRDPLARYFQDLNDSDLDSDESEEEKDTTESQEKVQESHTHNCSDKSTEGVTNDKEGKTKLAPDEALPDIATVPTADDTTNSCTESVPSNKKLPSAHNLLNSKLNADFLMLNKKQEVNWEKSVIKLEGGTEQISPEDYKSNAVPPPSSYEPITDPGIKVVDSEGRKRKTSAEDMTTRDGSKPQKAYRVTEEKS